MKPSTHLYLHLHLQNAIGALPPLPHMRLGVVLIQEGTLSDFTFKKLRHCASCLLKAELILMTVRRTST